MGMLLPAAEGLNGAPTYPSKCACGYSIAGPLYMLHITDLGRVYSGPKL